MRFVFEEVTVRLTLDVVGETYCFGIIGETPNNSMLLNLGTLVYDKAKGEGTIKWNHKPEGDDARKKLEVTLLREAKMSAKHN